MGFCGRDQPANTVCRPTSWPWHAAAQPADRLVGAQQGLHRYQGVPLVVTYHPAYLLRSPLDKARAWDDLCLADATVEAGTA